jgi:hypothetical protein
MTQESARPTPTLAEIAANPALVDQLPGAVAGALGLEATGLVQRLMVRAVIAPPPVDADELLDARHAAQRLGMSPITLQHRAHQSPYRELRVDNGTRRLLFSRRRLEAFLLESARSPSPASASRDTPGPRGVLPVPPPPRRKGQTGRPAPSSVLGPERGGDQSS